MNAVVQDFLDCDAETTASREQYISFAKNILNGHHADLELTGNAFTVRFTSDGVEIGSLWDDGVSPCKLELEEFIALLSAEANDLGDQK